MDQTKVAKPVAGGKKFELYGQVWGIDTPLLAIELMAYRNNWSENGFHGAHYHFKKAFNMFYPNFQWHEWVELQIWAWCNYKICTTIGHTRASKTFTIAHIVYLDWQASPMPWKNKEGEMVGGTWTSLATTTFDGLRNRMWNDLMTAVSNGRLPGNFPHPFRISTTTKELSIKNYIDSSMSKEEASELNRYQIEGFAISANKNATARIHGKHANRRRIILDEAGGMDEAVFLAEENAQSAGDYKGVRLANPDDKYSAFGLKCEPKDGWNSVSDNDLFWIDKKDNIVLHLDGYQSHNMKTYYSFQRGEINEEEYKKKLLKFQPQPEFFLKIDKDSLEYWMYAKAFFPPDGLVSKVFPDVFIDNACKPNKMFPFGSFRIATLDPAFEQDDCVFHYGECGKLEGDRYHVNWLGTEKIMTVKGGGGGSKPKDYQIATKTIELCQQYGVYSENFIMDKSGNGRGVFSIMCVEWEGDKMYTQEPEGCEFSGHATDRILREGDSDQCNKLYKFFVTELWFRAAEWMRYGDVTGLNNLDELTKKDLSSRQYLPYNSEGKNLVRVEMKADMKKRIGRSPDFGDSFCLFAELLARKGIYCGLKKNDNTELVKGSMQQALQRAIKVNDIYGEEFEGAYD